ncbi:hypothetical protein C3F09_10880 [candidate division GN15 bacterium]|uniref:Uncharacterized protein n=1 Tax=candidate division GN15 bacterium TaxID=2072418 RepID=A0A855WW81_9BACT|nr:MAG: hypothetical protein C3F09_10880 [candidate division GN15 bacterium]
MVFLQHREHLPPANQVMPRLPVQVPSKLSDAGKRIVVDRTENPLVEVAGVAVVTAEKRRRIAGMN